MRKKHEVRKAEIVEGTLELAAEVGLGKVTTQAIADRIGIAQPTIFRHFKTRDAIFREAIEWIASTLLGALGGVFNSDKPADERLQLLLKRQLSFIGKQRGIPRLLFSDRLHLEDPELKKTVRKIMDNHTLRIAGLVREGMDSGRFRRDLDPEEAARWIVTLIQGLVMRWSIYDFSFSLGGQADALWDFIWPALAPEKTEKTDP